VRRVGVVRLRMMRLGRLGRFEELCRRERFFSL
jgi:hypothetical protein